jgi:hypothetical protein
MEEERLHPTHLSLRTDRLSERPQDFDVPPSTRPRVWTGLYEMGLYNGAAVTLVCNVDGSCSLYSSGGGHILGLGGVPSVAEAALAFVYALEDHLDSLPPIDDIPPLPGPNTLRFIAITFEGLHTAVIDQAKEPQEGHPLATLNNAGQEVIAQIRLHEERLASS